ncbi:ubiquitin thioesterase otub1 [Phytophthora cinnamomi]|uniref:ubiquitin thioesterase otub1 n=1 Tax=Phytophthora cinnamomi TaxID=4785 RepID=UPI00355992B4|nr:ubiquitin thioesterase otub1 [Phytophthora cinnamomi]
MALLLVLATISFAGGGVGAYLGAPEQDDSVVSFLRERTTWHPMCLYTFDDPGIGSSVTVANRVPGGACPFEALQPDNELVTSLNAAPSFWQLGVHLSEDPNNDTKRVQLSSISSVSAREFFTMAAVRNESVSESGVTFEMVIRPRAKTNQSMTLFSVANEYNNCVDPGFRLDLNEHRVLALIYFIPVLAEGGDAGVEACYEQRLFSVDTSAACQLPPVLDPVERTPAVQITVTLDPSSEKGLWKTDFYMSYTDVDTIQKVDCAVHDEQHPPSTQVLNKLIEGRYRLYLGNNPRNVISPRKRKRLAPLREFQFLGNSSGLNATERLRAMLKQKLMSISGPRLPKAMRIFGDNSLSLHILGVTFPPLNEDTPLAYLRSKIADFKEQYGEFAKVAACQRKYEELMETISWSSTVASAYDPSEPSREVNCELMGMCLMNIHSLLDSYFPEFEQRLQQTQNSMNCEQVAAVITRMTRLLKALSVPLASIDELIECARPELLQDPLLWNDFSFLEWHRRAETQRVRRRPTHCIGGENPHSLLAEQFDDDSDCILEQEDESPHDADWLNTFDSDSRL